MLAQVIRAFRRHRAQPWHHLVLLVLALFEFNPEFDRFGVSLRPLFKELRDAPRDARSLALILDRLYRYHGESVNRSCERWGDKTPLNIYCLPELRSVFPGAQFIHVVRDGVDAVYSMLVKTKHRWNLEKASERWRTSVEAATRFRSRHADAVYEVRYEDIVRFPVRTARAVCGFLDTPFDPAKIRGTSEDAALGDLSTYDHHSNVRKAISTESIGKGRRALSLEQRRELQRLIGDELARLGYEPAV